MGERKRKEEVSEIAKAGVADTTAPAFRRTCGNCDHGVVGVGANKLVDLNIRVCFRYPETPVVMIHQGLDGLVHSSLQMARPVKAASTRHCGEWAPKTDEPTGPHLSPDNPVEGTA